MKLDRDIPENAGQGKYALLKLRVFRDLAPEVQRKAAEAMATLEGYGILDWGVVGTESEFFLIRLKDKYAAPALRAYANAARHDDVEYSDAVRDMASRSSELSPFCKKPD